MANDWLGATRLQVAATCLGRAERAMEQASEAERAISATTALCSSTALAIAVEIWLICAMTSVIPAI